MFVANSRNGGVKIPVYSPTPTRKAEFWVSRVTQAMGHRFR